MTWKLWWNLLGMLLLVCAGCGLVMSLLGYRDDTKDIHTVEMGFILLILAKLS